jgi:uncharacterized protein YjbI with pentapeptide repeats
MARSGRHLDDEVPVSKFARISGSDIKVVGMRGLLIPKQPPSAGAIWRLDVMAENARFRDQAIEHAVFQDCSMVGARFEDTNLSRAVFTDVDLSRATFRNVNLAGVSIDDADIDGLTIFGHDIQALIRAEPARRDAG